MKLTDGNNDMVSPDAVNSLVEKAKHNPDFTKVEVDTLREIVEIWRGFQAVGRAAGLVRRVLMWIGWAVGVYLAVKYALAEWVKTVPR